MQPRYLTLDGLRGIAVLIIVMRHETGYFRDCFASSHLAPDLFFCLSGFVLSAVYGPRLVGGTMSFRQLMKQRVVRIWPLYLLAIGAALLADVGRAMLVGEATPGAGVSAILSVVLIPTPTSVSDLPAVFPLLYPAWTLLWEMIASVAFGLAIYRWRCRRLFALAALGIALLIATVVSYGTLNVGALWSGFWGGGARTLYSFTAGMLVYRFRPSDGLAWPAWPCVAGFLVLLAGSAHNVALYDLLVVVVGFPLLIWTGSAARPKVLSGKLFTLVGAASYTVYLFHPTFFRAAGFLGARGAIVGMGLLAALFIVGSIVDRHIDAPMRKRLMRAPEKDRFTQQRASAL